MPGKGCHGDLGMQWQNNFPGNTMQMREGEGAGGGAGMATGSAFHVEIIVRGQYMIPRIVFYK